MQVLPSRKRDFLLFRKIAVSAALVFAFWLILHLPFLAWGLPNIEPPEADPLPPCLNYTVKDRFVNMSYFYPPLQYLICDAVFAKRSETDFKSKTDLMAARSDRVFGMRSISALMALGMAMAIGLGAFALSRSSLAFVAAACASLLAPVGLLHSLSANLTGPHVFWWTLALLFALLAALRRERDVWGRGLDVLAGVALGFSAATKDQTYAYALVPLLALLLVKRSFGWRRAVECAALWFFSSFLVYGCVWLLAGGWEPFVNHLGMIRSDKGVGPALVENSFSGRLGLLAWSVSDFFRMADWPLAIAFVVSLAALAQLAFFAAAPLGRDSRVCKSSLLAALFCVVALLSTSLFFLQVVRFSTPRYLLPALPFVCVALGLAVSRIERFGKMFQAVLGVCMAASLLIAFQLLNAMSGDSRIALRDALTEIGGEAPATSVAVAGLAPFEVFRFVDGKPEPLRRLRDWSDVKFGLASPLQRPIALSAFFLAMVEPGLLAVEASSLSPEKEALLEQAGFAKACEINRKTPLLFTLFPYDGSAPFKVFAKRGSAKLPVELVEKDLRSMSFELQLASLSFASSRPFQTESQRLLAGRCLAPFQDPDLLHWYVSSDSVGIAAFDYLNAKRADDAGKAFFFGLTRFRNDSSLAFAVLRFFKESPEQRERFNLSLVEAPDGSISWRLLR